MPIIFAAAQRVQTRGVERGGNAYVLVGILALAGLSVLHGLVPPHPGPLLAISALGAPIGTTILYGLIVAIPTVIIAGPLFARVAMRWAQADPPQALIEQLAGDERSESAPRFSVTLATVLLPVALMLIRAGTDVALGKSNHVREWADFIGDPATALLIGVLALWTFGVARGFDRDRLNRFCTDALAPTATITAAGIMVPIAAHTSVDRPLLALAIGCGSLFFSQVNDAGFWLVNQ